MRIFHRIHLGMLGERNFLTIGVPQLLKCKCETQYVEGAHPQKEVKLGQ